MWQWKGQWPLDSWINETLTVLLFAWALWLATSLGHSFVGVFNKRVDRVFIEVLRKWRAELTARLGDRNP